MNKQLLNKQLIPDVNKQTHKQTNRQKQINKQLNLLSKERFSCHRWQHQLELWCCITHYAHIWGEAADITVAPPTDLIFIQSAASDLLMSAHFAMHVAPPTDLIVI